MPTLLEVQHAISRCLIHQDDGEAAGLIIASGVAPDARLSIYRNTFIGTLTTALRLSFPAVHRLVGAEFFETAARLFIEAEPPRSAYLDEYGAGFPEFLDQFAPAASLTYLAGVARLEWAVSHALHAPDAQALEASSLAEVESALHGLIAFVPHPSVALVQAEHPVDAIWRAVLAQDDHALAAIEVGSAPVWLLVHRGADGVEVTRCIESAWRFAADLFASRPLEAAIEAHPDVEASALLAGHLLAKRFAGFQLLNQIGGLPAPQEHSR
jgi:hypothetical protein